MPSDNKALLLTTGKPILVNADDYRHANSVFTIDEFTPAQVRHLVDKFRHFGPYDKDLRDFPTRTIH